MKSKVLIAAIALMLAMPIVFVSAESGVSGCLFQLVHGGRNNYFEVEAVPGETIELHYTITNATDSVETNHILLYDSQTAVNGGNVIMTPANYVCGETAAWFVENCEEITLNPGQTVSKKLVFTVPEEAEDGIYTAILGLYVYGGRNTVGNSNESTEVEFRINNNYSSTLAVVITVGNEFHREVELGKNAEIVVDVNSGKSFLYIPVYNKGNAYEFPLIECRIYDDENNLIIEDSIEMDIVYRKTNSFAAIETTGEIYKSGNYSAEVQMEYGKQEKKRVTFEYLLNISDETARKTIENQVNKEEGEEKSTAWTGDFLVIGKKEMLFGGAGILGITVLTVLIFVVIKKTGRA